MLTPRALPFDLREWREKPFRIRLEWLCKAWVTQGFGAPPGVYLFYLFKILLFIIVWLVACIHFHHLGSLSDFSVWCYDLRTLKLLIVWAILFELLGFGCGSGPLTGRYMPPITAFMHFLRPGTIKSPLYPFLPFFGGDTRRVWEVLLYGLILGFLGKILFVSSIKEYDILIIVGLILLLTLSDKTVYLAARSEHYLIALICIYFSGDAISGLKLTWIAIWFWAATSKLNRHFPYVISVMVSNHPLIFSKAFKKRMFKDFPKDLRPSQLSGLLAHFGTITEYTFPVLLLLGEGGMLTLIGLSLMLLFHFFITSSIPMGVPLEWNVVMVFGAFVLFGQYADVSVFDIDTYLLYLVLIVSLVVFPLLGNIYPKHFSFLVSMRYYAGNWAHSIWLFKKGAEDKLDKKIKKSASIIPKQLSPFYDELTCYALLSKVAVFRALHLHGRIAHRLLKYMVDDMEQYEWRDGENVAGVVLGWNFGEGHIHDEQLLRAMQKRCAFLPGELRCLMVESQPMFKSYQKWRIYDAHDGLMLASKTKIDSLLDRQPWPQKDPFSI